MATVKQCDRCHSTENVRITVMTVKGIHLPEPAFRQEGPPRFGGHNGIDLCESCRVSLQCKWAEKARNR